MMFFALTLVLATLHGSFCSEVKFRWLSERSADGVPHLAITMPDGTLRHAILSRYNPIPVELDETNSPVDECIFNGYLDGVADSKVVVTGGCPGEDKFSIGMVINKEAYHLSVEDGVGKEVESVLGRLVPDKAVYLPDDQADVPTQTTSASERVAFPTSGFNFNLSIYYDISFNNRFGADSVNAIRRIVALAQLIYNWPSFGVPLLVNVASVSFQNTDIPANGTGLGVLANYTIDGSNIHSKVGMTTIGQNGGIAYVGVVCYSDLRYRTAVISAGSWSEQSTAEIMAHELGHNLNMPHDFLDPFSSPKTQRNDSKGATCTDINGVMDYYVTVKQWSTCSAESFNNYYQPRATNFCMNTNQNPPVTGQWSDWGAWTTCSKTCGGGTYTRSRVCNNPLPSAGGAYCVGSSDDVVTACNTQACPWGGYPFYLCSNKASVTYTCGTAKMKLFGAGWMRRSTSVCVVNSSSTSTTSCFLDITTNVNATQCPGTTSSCTFKLPTGLADPCPGIDKYMQFNIGCV